MDASNKTFALAYYENSTEHNVPLRKPGPHVFGIVIQVVYVIGIIMNAAAIVAVRKGKRRVRNRKHLLLLTSLAANDLVALVGMLCAMLVSEHVPWVKGTRVFCAARVMLRVFGIGSGCIAVTMALERYLALTRPFLYQKQITYVLIRWSLLVGWLLAAVLTCTPVFGLGLYYDADKGECLRYRQAVTPLDFGYAVFYVIFGTLLCAILVYCNLAVISALYAFTRPRAGDQPVVRRVSKSSCRQRQRSVKEGNDMQHTAEEVAFSRLMAILSLLFIACWMPQMVTSMLYLALGKGDWARLDTLGRLSDVLMLCNYVFDPMVYVLRVSPSAFWHSIGHCFKRNHRTSTESMKTSCCPPETTVLSDSSAAEMRPLRPPPYSTLTPNVPPAHTHLAPLTSLNETHHTPYPTL